MSNYEPVPPGPIPSGQDWGEETLIRDMRERGYHYYVQFAERSNMDSGRIHKTDECMAWLVAQGWQRFEDWNWIGGRFYYEFAFKDEEVAMMFKLAHGR